MLHLKSIRSLLFYAASVVWPATLPAQAQVAPREPPLEPRTVPFRPPWPDDLTPVKLNIPMEYVPTGSFRASAIEPTMAGMALDYPSMRPWPNTARCKTRCEGQVYLFVRTGMESEMNRAAWRVRRRLLVAGAQPDLRESLTPVSPPHDFTQAWEQVSLQPPAAANVGTATSIYLRGDADGKPSEYVECTTRYTTPGNEPMCITWSTLDGQSSVAISYYFRLQHWPERDAIRAAVTRLVRSWL